MEGYDRRILFLAAESTAGLGLNYDRLFIGQVQGTFQGTVDVVRALERADDLDGSIRFRNSDGSLWLDIQLLLKTDPENPLHHLQILQTLQIVQNLAFPDFDCAEDFGCLVEQVDGLGGLIVDLDVAGSLIQHGPIGSRQQQDRCLTVPDLPALGARTGCSSRIRWTTFSPGMSSAVTTTTPDQSKAGSNVMDWIVPRGIVDRTVLPYQAPAMAMSSV